MKKKMVILAVLIFISFFGVSLVSAETPPLNSSAKPETLAQPAEKTKRIEGEITKIDTMLQTLTIKKTDGSEITLKATTPKAQEEIKKLSVGKNVVAICKEKKKKGLVLIRISEEKPLKDWKKGKK